MSNRHVSTKRLILDAQTFIDVNYTDRMELGALSTLKEIGIGTPPGCYPLTVTLSAAPYGSDSWYEERGTITRAMRKLGWHESGEPDPVPPDFQKVIFNIRPDVVERLMECENLNLKGTEHYTPEPTSARNR